MPGGRFGRWRSWATTASLIAGWGAAGSGRAAVVRVPVDVPGIQAAIDAAQGSDTVLISRGTYAGGLVISGKSITLASRYIETGDTSDIALTTLAGGGTILTIDASAGAATTVRGLTFLDGSYQIENYARRVSILDDRFIGGGADQMSFEGAGGLVRGCRFDHAGDDAIDVDDSSDPTIENNTILNAGDDGIELRLHPYTGPTLQIVFRGNHISGCREDGIQLIDYAGASSRDFLIEGNVLANNFKVGLASMADGNTVENGAGAPLVEPVRVIGNTISGNPIGVTGGDDMLLMNNIIAGSTQIGLKRVATSSLASYNDLWGNATNYANSLVETSTTFLEDPRLDVDWDLEDGSPCIDAGAVSIVWNGMRVGAPAYLGMAPDLGARESPSGSTVSVPPPSPPAGLAFAGVRPNPSANGVAISFTLPDRSPARIEVVDLAGRRLVVRELGALGQGKHVVRLTELRGLPAGVYQVRLVQGARSVATPIVVAR